jgi:tetratricopeptide (TPR) repeat protein
MILTWFNGREAAEIGAALADEFAARASDSGSIEQLLRRSDSEVRPLQFNFFKKAKFANSFKWRLIESGVSRKIADEVTQSLVLHLSRRQLPASNQNPADAQAKLPNRATAGQLARRGGKLFEKGAYAEAAALFEEALELDSSQVEAINALGASLSFLGRYDEAEQCFRDAIALKPNFAEPHGNLGILQRLKAELLTAEASLRYALKLKPNYIEAKLNLGLTLTLLGRLRDAKACFAKVLKAAPRNVQALQGMGQIAAFEGQFEEAESMFRRAIAIDARMPAAWAALAVNRKMTSADQEWLKNAEMIADSGIHPLEEVNLRFAIGKYYDDVDDFAPAFQNFRRGNELLKAATKDYDRKERSRRIDEMIRVYSRDALSKIEGAGSSSAKPVFVVGMPRSGTSLAEQIIASHPAAYGAGEVQFWDRLVFEDAGITKEILSEPARVKVAERYLDILQARSANALRVVDKSPENSNYLGLIYSIFPNARVICMQRDPIDTCLSCYFQRFATNLNFTLDLSDLAHYYGEYRRIMAHWRAVLPPGQILDVPYEELVANQETWSRKMLEFIGLEWDPRVLEFHATKRPVVTASNWQVRQKMFTNSVARWHHYEKFIGPLKSLNR